VAVSGQDLFVTNPLNGTIGEYTTSGAVVDATLISGLNSPTGIAVSGNKLFVLNDSDPTGYIGEYTTSGAVVNQTLVPGLAFALVDLAVAPVPEPATYVMVLLGLGVLGVALRRRRALDVAGSVA
jgi:DNA-binding beta-propeller fold protein YncE